MPQGLVLRVWILPTWVVLPLASSAGTSSFWGATSRTSPDRGPYLCRRIFEIAADFKIEPDHFLFRTFADPGIADTAFGENGIERKLVSRFYRSPFPSSPSQPESWHPLWWECASPNARKFFLVELFDIPGLFLPGIKLVHIQPGIGLFPHQSGIGIGDGAVLIIDQRFFLDLGFGHRLGSRFGAGFGLSDRRCALR